MKFTELALGGAFLIEPERHEDERGFFARTFCATEFAARALNPAVAHCSVSYNRRRGTLRGLHYQAAPHAEDKLVRCTAGAVFDVIVDLRPGSATFRRWVGLELSAAQRRMLYVPAGLAHGFQTLADDTELFYQISTPYVPEAARGVRWDDPELAIPWPPVASRVISPRDLALPTLAGGLTDRQASSR
jgi:dTDP-4-dehydrorhamnose 3,5-epimerase